MFAYVYILYDEPDPTTYRGVRVHVEGNDKTFFEGDPTTDYLAALLFASLLGAVRIASSSSVDGFAIDGGSLRTEGFDEGEVERAKAVVRDVMGAR